MKRNLLAGLVIFSFVMIGCGSSDPAATDDTPKKEGTVPSTVSTTPPGPGGDAAGEGK